VLELGGQVFALAVAVEGLQWIGRHGHDAWALGAVGPHQRIALAKVELFADGGRDGGLVAADDGGLSGDVWHMGGGCPGPAQSWPNKASVPIAIVFTRGLTRMASLSLDH